MATSNKIRVVKDYDKLTLDIQNQIKNAYPQGFAEHLITYIDAKGKVVSALPYETDDYYYLVRMSLEEAYDISDADKEYDIEGVLHEEFPMGEFEGEAEDEEEDINDIPDDVADEEEDESDDEF
jgi:CRISPR/Cas system CSM-associated protein Csm4 (group 5 of RAMP superfamily)